MKWYGYALIGLSIPIVVKLFPLLSHRSESLAAVGAGILILVATPLLMRRARTKAETGAAEVAPHANLVIDRRSERFLLYLRSFEYDASRPADTLLERHLLGAYGLPEESKEMALISKLSVIAPVVAIGKPASESSSQLGAFRYYVPQGDDWQVKVRQLMEQADSVLVRIDSLSPGLKWELENLRNERGYRRTAVMLADSNERETMYAHLLTVLPDGLRSGMPVDVTDIRAIYVDSRGEPHLVRKTLAFAETLESSASGKIVELMMADTWQRPEGGQVETYAMAGVRCWHRKGIGMTPRHSFAGKISIANTGFRFLSAGSSLTREIIDHGLTNASASLTEGLGPESLGNPGSLEIPHERVEAMEIFGSFMQTLHIRIQYRDPFDELCHCSLAIDGAFNRNTLKNLEYVVQHFVAAHSARCPDSIAQTSSGVMARPPS